MVELHNDSATELGSDSPQNARETEKLVSVFTSKLPFACVLTV